MARYGAGVRDALEVVGTAIGGRTATQVYEGNRSFDVVVRFPEEKRASLETLRNIRIETAEHNAVPLHQIADVSLEEGPVQISRENGQRRIGIEVNIHGRDIGGFVAEAKQKISRNVSLPPGVALSGADSSRTSSRPCAACRSLPGRHRPDLPAALPDVQLDPAAALVIVNLPLALIGGIVALYVSGMYLSVPASVGFIVLFGVAVLNGVVLVSCISMYRLEGSPNGGVGRRASRDCRPVLMTASITIFSLVPLLFASGPGSEIQKPLAVVVVGGLITSTFLNSAGPAGPLRLVLKRPETKSRSKELP